MNASSKIRPSIIIAIAPYGILYYPYSQIIEFACLFIRPKASISFQGQKSKQKQAHRSGEPENNQLFFEVVERLDAVVFRYIAEHVFDAEKLVVFRDTVCT